MYSVISNGAMGTLELFPGIACSGPDGTCRIHISGQLRRPYQPTIRKRMLIRFLAKMMGAKDDEIESPLFRSRVEPFVSDGWGGVELDCQLGERVMRLTLPTRRNGHFAEWLTIDSTTCQAATVVRGDRQWVAFTVRAPQIPSMDDQGVAGGAIALKPQGVSVVSDVDDTIKETHIGVRRELLANTFLREFREIEGMAELYRRWAQQGFDFHYVSSSPWQLFFPLWQMLNDCEFPLGSVHLRAFRLRNHMLQRMVRIRRSGKARAIRELLWALPQRKFLLVGDSGEKDLELYGRLASRYPGRVGAIMIREIPASGLSSRRLERCRNRLPDVPCLTFNNSEDLLGQTQQLLANLGTPTIWLDTM